MAQRRDQSRALAVERGGRSLQEDDERRRVAEMALGKLFAASGGSPRNLERERVEAALYAETDDPEQRAEQNGTGQPGKGRAMLQRRQYPPIEREV